MEKEIKIKLSLIASFLCIAKLQLTFLGSLNFEGVSRSPATSNGALFDSGYNYLLITNVVRTSVLDIVGALDPPLLLMVVFFRVIFLKFFVSQFALIFGLLWEWTFNAAYILLFNENLDMPLIVSYDENSSKPVSLLLYLHCHGKV